MPPACWVIQVKLRISPLGHWLSSFSSLLCLVHQHFTISIAWGWDCAQVWRRLLFLASIFQANGMFKPVFCADFLVRRFLRPIFTQTFGSQIFVLIFRRFFFNILALAKIGVPESRKNAQKICGKICGVRMAPLGGGTPFHVRFLEQTARHTTAARPTYSRRACERPS